MAKGKFVNKLISTFEARRGRAQEMGFKTDMPLYHGTNRDVDAFDLSRGGETSRSPVGELGVSLATDADTAGEFANLAGSEGANVIQAYHRASRPARIELDGTEMNHEIAATVREAWDQGFDAIKFNNYTTPAGETGRSFVLVRDPAQIRSVNAKFDPKKKSSRDLLAGTMPPVVGASLLASQDADATAPRSTEQFARQRIAETMAHGEMPRTVSPPKRPGFAKAAELAAGYNRARKERLHPILDAVLPGGEMPAEYLNKVAYDKDIRWSDRLKASLGLL